MTGEIKTGQKLYTATKISIWLGILVLGIVAVGLSLYYENNGLLEISVGLLSGAAISFVTSFTITQQDSKSTREQSDKMLLLLKTIGDDIQNNNIPNGVRIYQNSRNDGLDINAMLKGAKKRIWILGTDLSNTLVRSGDQIIEAFEQNPDLELRILALHPQNLFVTTRYSEIGWSHASEMRQSVYEAQENLGELLEKIKKVNPNANATVRLYMSQPTVTLYIVDHDLVISHLIVGSRTSDSLQLRCDMDICNQLGQDFVDQHFQSIWDSAIHLENAQCYYDKESVYTLSMNGQITEYNLSGKGTAYRRCCKQLRLAWKKIEAFIGQHAAPLSVPILSMLVGGIFLYLTRTGSMLQISSEFVLNNYYTNTALGFISGGILTIIEYWLEIWSETRNVKQHEVQMEQEAEMIRKCLDDVFFQHKENEHGIFVCENRNSVGIKERILNAKKRVWIFATNHRYISSLDVHRFLKENAADMDIRFLMLSPQSMFVSTRFSEIPKKNSAADFGQEINNNLKHLVNEYKDSPKVGIRLYHRQPTFMMYLIDDTLIISHILRQGRARDQAHFIFDLNYPRVSIVANDYIHHFLEVWDESARIKKSRVVYDDNGQYFTTTHGLTTNVSIAQTTDLRSIFVKE